MAGACYITKCMLKRLKLCADAELEFVRSIIYWETSRSETLKTLLDHESMWYDNLRKP